LFSYLRIVFIGPITNKKVCRPSVRGFLYKQALPQNFLILWLAITKNFASAAFVVPQRHCTHDVSQGLTESDREMV
jgi:hypothetical protein